MSADLLRLEAVSKIFATPDGGRTTILDNINCIINPGETVAIVGPSGSGKSTLLNVIGGLDQPTSGHVWLGELEVNALAGKALANFRATKLGFVFQDHHLLPQLTALENVLLPTLAGKAEKTAGERAAGLLERVGVAARRDAFPAQLSGGERQRVAVARALINHPDLLLCDEPTGNLDHATGAEVVGLLLELAAGQGVTVLMVTHNAEQAARFGRCLELADGTLQTRAAGGGP
jgi:putative ABC transport system ATP-binding protein